MGGKEEENRSRPLLAFTRRGRNLQDGVEMGKKKRQTTDLTTRRWPRHKRQIKSRLLAQVGKAKRERPFLHQRRKRDEVTPIRDEKIHIRTEKVTH